jgi:hypothetical protein
MTVCQPDKENAQHRTEGTLTGVKNYGGEKLRKGRSSA